MVAPADRPRKAADSEAGAPALPRAKAPPLAPPNLIEQRAPAEVKAPLAKALVHLAAKRKENRWAAAAGVMVAAPTRMENQTSGASRKGESPSFVRRARHTEMVASRRRASCAMIDLSGGAQRGLRLQHDLRLGREAELLCQQSRLRTRLRAERSHAKLKSTLRPQVRRRCRTA